MTTNLQKRQTPAFTMVELMVSILIVAILMLGVNAVFKMSADTVGGGMATLEGMRNHRAAANTLASDFRGMLNADEMPFFIIYSQTTPAFMNERDAKSDTNYTSGAGLNAAQLAVLQHPDVAGAPQTPLYVVNDRNHRTDVIQYFTHGEGLFRRQTGGQNVANTAAGNPTYQSAFTADTAWVWIGHARLPNNDQVASVPFNAANSVRLAKHPGVMPDPTSTGGASAPLVAGGGSNDNNFYAGQWVLCRRAMLLAQPDANNRILDANNVQQRFVQLAANNSKPLSPLAYSSTCTDGFSQIQDSICDLAGRSVTNMRSDVQKLAGYYGTYNPDWYVPLLWTRGTNSVAQNLYRFIAKPWVDKTRGTGNGLNTFQDEMALTTPILLPGCSQFIVEFAGDYLTQNPTTGVPTKETSDGIIDFNYDTANGTRGIRWYGLSRSMNGCNAVSTDQLNGAGDVRPLFTYLPQTGPAPFEKVTGATANVLPKSKPTNMATYTCAWSADELTAPVTRDTAVLASATSRWPNGSLPWLIRITIRLDDRNGRLPDGQTLEYIFRMPGH